MFRVKDISSPAGEPRDVLGCGCSEKSVGRHNNLVARADPACCIDRMESCCARAGEYCVLAACVGAQCIFEPGDDPGSVRNGDTFFKLTEYCLGTALCNRRPGEMGFWCIGYRFPAEECQIRSHNNPLGFTYACESTDI